MIKKLKKLSAVLIALSLVTLAAPASAAEAATILPSRTGSFNDAVSYLNQYLFSGTKPGLNNALYCDAMGVNSAVGNMSTFNASPLTKYSSNMLTIGTKKDPSIQTILPLYGTKRSASFAYLNETVASIRSVLASDLSSTARYGTAVNNLTTFPALREITGSVFGDKWYQYVVTPSAGSTGCKDVIPQVNHYGVDSRNASKNVLMGFVNISHVYVDTSTKANIYVFSKSAKKMVKVDNFNEMSSEGNVIAKLDNYIGFLGEDKDNFYTLISVSFTGADPAYNMDVNGSAKASSFYIQKISKKQGEKKDGVYLPKSVTSYEIGSVYYDNDNIDNATMTLLDDYNDPNYIAGIHGQSAINKSDHCLYISQISRKGDKARISKFELKEDTAVFVTGDNTLSTKITGNFVERSAQDEVPIVKSTPNNIYYNLVIPADRTTCLDADTNFWVLGQGKIYKFQDNHFQERFNCNTSINCLDVYNDYNLISWNNKGNVYSCYQGGNTSYQ